MVFLKYIVVIGIAYLLFKRFSTPTAKINKKEGGNVDKEANKENIKGGDYIDYEELDD